MTTATRRYRHLRSERGISAMLLAASMLLLIGSAAIAVDVSGFYEQASSQRRAADLACLAGVIEMPENSALAVETAAAFLAPNHRGLASITPAVTSSGSAPMAGLNTYVVGNHAVEIEAPYAGSATKMRVSILQARGTDFAAVWGVNDVDILETAVCEVGSALAGGDMPFGLLSGFSGGLINFGKNKCTLNGDTSSQCSGLAIPRHDDPVGSQFGVRTSNNFVANIVSGINWQIANSYSAATGWRLDPAAAAVLCPPHSTNEPCNAVATVSGDDPGKVFKGLISGYGQYSPKSEIGYLEPLHGDGRSLTFGADTGQPATFDGHDMGDVLTCNGVSCPTALESYTWTGTEEHSVVAVDAVTDCNCRRLARVPIVKSFPDSSCTVSDPNDSTQVNKCSAEIIGWEWVWILRPYFVGTDSLADDGADATYTDFDNDGAGNTVRVIAAVAVDISGATVEGDCFSAYKEGAPKRVRLIDG